MLICLGTFTVKRWLLEHKNCSAEKWEPRGLVGSSVGYGSGWRMSHVLQDNVKIQYAAQNGEQFKIYGLFTSGMFYLVYLVLLDDCREWDRRNLQYKQPVMFINEKTSSRQKQKHFSPLFLDPAAFRDRNVWPQWVAWARCGGQTVTALCSHWPDPQKMLNCACVKPLYFFPNNLFERQRDLSSLVDRTCHLNAFNSQSWARLKMSYRLSLGLPTA